MKYNTLTLAASLATLMLSLTWLPAASAQHNLEKAQADWPDLKLLAPEQVRGLNKQLTTDLQKRGCQIPMFTKWDGRHNVISGSFIRAGSKDIAVLCLTEDNMSIIVYPNGSSQNAHALRQFPPDAYRMIHRVSPFVMKKKAIRDDATQRLPDFDHDGIEDGPVGGRSETVYFHEGIWTNVF
ncbi:MAG: hypothetical protein PVH05_12580 [Burkholderiales bacterium]|jgi:hypothetical protein